MLYTYFSRHPETTTHRKSWIYKIDSAYICSHHDTKMSLEKVTNYLLIIKSNSYFFVPYLQLLYGSVEYSLLEFFSILGFQGSTLPWFSFFLTNHSLMRSPFFIQPLKISISQGSVIIYLFTMHNPSAILYTLVVSTLVCIPVTPWNLYHQSRLLSIFQINTLFFNP